MKKSDQYRANWFANRDNLIANGINPKLIDCQVKLDSGRMARVVGLRPRAKKQFMFLDTNNNLIATSMNHFEYLTRACGSQIEAKS